MQCEKAIWILIDRLYFRSGLDFRMKMHELSFELRDKVFATNMRESANIIENFGRV